ncbi:MAG: hypothetical protein ACP6IU_02485 [Candidatus Asgardarchaeia archaeon]
MALNTKESYCDLEKDIPIFWDVLILFLFVVGFLTIIINLFPNYKPYDLSKFVYTMFVGMIGIFVYLTIIRTIQINKKVGNAIEKFVFSGVIIGNIFTLGFFFINSTTASVELFYMLTKFYYYQIPYLLGGVVYTRVFQKKDIIIHKLTNYTKLVSLTKDAYINYIKFFFPVFLISALIFITYMFIYDYELHKLPMSLIPTMYLVGLFLLSLEIFANVIFLMCFYLFSYTLSNEHCSFNRVFGKHITIKINIKKQHYELKLYYGIVIILLPIILVIFNKYLGIPSNYNMRLFLTCILLIVEVIYFELFLPYSKNKELFNMLFKSEHLQTIYLFIITLTTLIFKELFFYNLYLLFILLKIYAKQT